MKEASIAFLGILIIVILATTFSPDNLAGDAFRQGQLDIETEITSDTIQLTIFHQEERMYSLAFIETANGWEQLILSQDEWIENTVQTTIELTREQIPTSRTIQLATYSCTETCDSAWQLSKLYINLSQANSTNSTSSTNTPTTNNTTTNTTTNTTPLTTTIQPIQTNLVTQLSQAQLIPTNSYGEGPETLRCDKQFYMPYQQEWIIGLNCHTAYNSPAQFLTFNTKTKDMNILDSKNLPYNFDFYNVRVFEDYAIITGPASTGRLFAKFDFTTKNFASLSISPPETKSVDTFSYEGRLYALGWKGAYLYVSEFNPITETFTLSPGYTETVHPSYTVDYHKFVASGDWVYVVIGKNPWWLVGYNTQTQTWKKFIEMPGIGYWKTISIELLEDGSVGGSTEDEQGMKQLFVLDNGVLNYVQKSNNGIPVYQHPFASMNDYKHSLDAGAFVYHSLDPSLDPKSFVPPPILDKESFLPDSNTGITNIRYTYKGIQETRTTTQLYRYPDTLYAIAGNAKYLIGAANAYGQHIIYDRQTAKTYRFDDSAVSAYTAAILDDTAYVIGYPNHATIQYDLSTQSNTFLGYNKAVDSHMAFAGTAFAPDGTIYYGAAYSRNRPGGGIGWYSPITKKTEGKLLENHQIFWLTATDNGNTIVGSAKEQGGRLFVLDHTTKNLQELTIIGLMPGNIVGIGEDIIGYGDYTGTPVIYRMNPKTTAFKWIQEVPHALQTSFSYNRALRNDMVYDGGELVYSNMNQRLISINTESGEISVIGKLPQESPFVYTNGELFIRGNTFQKLLI